MTETDVPGSIIGAIHAKQFVLQAWFLPRICCAYRAEFFDQVKSIK